MKGYTKRININGICAFWNPFCEICGRVDKHRISFRKNANKYLCEKHSNQIYRHGEILEQTRYDRNQIEIKEDFAILYLNDRNGKIVAETIIDIEDIEKVAHHKWFMKMDGRIVSNKTNDNIGKSHIRIHNIIMDFDINDEFKVDHIDTNPLNNRKNNLRLVTNSKNGMNRNIQSNNSTGVTGVVSRDHNNTSPWIPQIKINRKMIRLGSENSFDKAVIKRLKSESELFKEFSRNHNPQTNTIQLTYHSHDDSQQTFIEMDMNGCILQFNKVGETNGTT